MRILFLNSIGKKKWGGGEKWMLMAASGLKERGHEVFIGCANNSIIHENSVAKDLKTLSVFFSSDFDFAGFIRLIRAIKRHKIDFIVCGQNKDSKIASMAARTLGGVTVIARHGLQLISKKIKYKFFFTKLIDGIITNSQSIKDEYDTYDWFSRDFVKVIHNGFTSPNGVKQESIRELYNIPTDELVIYSAGRLAKQKGYEILIEVASLARSLGKKWRFVVAGHGKLENKLKNIVNINGLNEVFYFQGFVADVLPFVKDCDIFVLPSYYEGMPNAVMEAMGLGKCCVVTSVNGNNELINEGQEGLLVNAGDVEGLYEALCKVADNKKLREQLGGNAQIKMEEQFSEEKMLNELEIFLKSKQKV